MNYIYDILVNFNEELYDFFDWNSNDEIEHIRKIPLFRINGKDFNNIKNNLVKFDREFIDKIQNKTESFKNRKIKNIEYAFLLTNGIEVIGYKLNSEYINKYSSYLLVDEDTEVMEVCERINEVSIKYKIIKNRKVNNFITRSDKDVIKFIKKEIKLLNKVKEEEKLKYLYYECFGKKEDDKDTIVKEINNCLNNIDEKVYMKIYDFLKLTSLRK